MLELRTVFSSVISKCLMVVIILATILVTIIHLIEMIHPHFSTYTYGVFYEILAYVFIIFISFGVFYKTFKNKNHHHKKIILDPSAQTTNQIKPQGTLEEKLEELGILFIEGVIQGLLK